MSYQESDMTERAADIGVLVAEFLEMCGGERIGCELLIGLQEALADADEEIEEQPAAFATRTLLAVAAVRGLVEGLETVLDPSEFAAE